MSALEELMTEENNKEKKSPKKRKIRKRLIIAGILLGVFLIFIILAAEFTSHSGFCAACHYMKPYFKSWEESSHSEFECNVCHYPPTGGIRSLIRKKVEGLVMVGRYWTKLYVKSTPWAEIRDESCLREGCHEKRLLEGEVEFNKVVFDHKIHFEDLKRGKQLQCTSCHSQIVQGEHITVTESSCFICHFKKSDHYPKIDDCSHCHKKDYLIREDMSRYNHSIVFDNGFSCDKCHTNTIIGDGEVPHENCYKCHMEQDRLEKYDDTELMHSLHIFETKIECNQCHMEIQHKIIKDIENIADCRSCHTDFHKAQKILYTGQGGKGVSHPIPNIMMEKGLSCKGCHVFHEEAGGKLLKSETFISEEEACESCHGKGFSRILNNWEVATQKKLLQIRRIYERTDQEIKQTKHTNKKEARSLLDEALFNIEIVDEGKSVHNMAFSYELLSAAFIKIEEALDLTKSAYRPDPFMIAKEEIPTQCSNCHSGIDEIEERVFGLEFSHKRHLIERKLNCSNCHSNARKHGEFIATKKSCALCHHDNPKKSCEECHPIQGTFYRGGTVSELDVPIDIMSEAGVNCEDCHRADNKDLIRSDRMKCQDCHEVDYSDMFDEWQKSIRELKNEAQLSLKEKKEVWLTDEEKEVLIKIKKVFDQIELDGSSGIHNFMFFEETLSEYKRILKELGKTGS